MRCQKTGKVGHSSRERAIIAAKRAGHILSAFRCSHCKQWHLGNTNNTRLANINRLFAKVAERERKLP